MIEKKALDVWESLETAHIIEMMRVISEIKYDSINPAIPQMMSQWLALNLNKVNIKTPNKLLIIDKTSSNFIKLDSFL